MFVAAEFAEGREIMQNFQVQMSSGDVKNKKFNADVRNVQMGKGTETKARSSMSSAERMTDYKGKGN